MFSDRRWTVVNRKTTISKLAESNVFVVVPPAYTLAPPKINLTTTEPLFLVQPIEVE